MIDTPKLQESAEGGCPPVTCSPSSASPENEQYLWLQLENARREREEWKACCGRYHTSEAALKQRLDDAFSDLRQCHADKEVLRKEHGGMVFMLRRIADKNDFMDREGLEHLAQNWLTRHGLQENADVMASLPRASADTPTKH